MQPTAQAVGVRTKHNRAPKGAKESVPCGDQSLKYEI